MASIKCKHCGAVISAYSTECEYCGIAVNRQRTGNSTQDFVNDFISGVNKATKTVDKTMSDDVNQNKVYAVLCYLGLLVAIPFFMRKDSEFVKFHLNQGLILLICDVCTSVISSILNTVHLDIGNYISLLGLVWFVFSIIGIVHAVKGEETELPIIGQFRILK